MNDISRFRRKKVDKYPENQCEEGRCSNRRYTPRVYAVLAGKVVCEYCLGISFEGYVENYGPQLRVEDLLELMKEDRETVVLTTLIPRLIYFIECYNARHLPDRIREVTRDIKRVLTEPQSEDRDYRIRQLCWFREELRMRHAWRKKLRGLAHKRRSIPNST